MAIRMRRPFIGENVELEEEDVVEEYLLCTSFPLAAIFLITGAEPVDGPKGSIGG